MPHRISALVIASSLLLSARVAAADEPPSQPPPPLGVQPPMAPAFPPPPPPPLAAQTSTPTIAVTVDAGREGVVLERRASAEHTYGRAVFVLPIVTSAESWEPVCITPCNVELSRWSSYRIAKTNGVTP